jgi:hypothetical protein
MYSLTICFPGVNTASSWAKKNKRRMAHMAVSKKRMERYITNLNLESEKAQKAQEQGQEMAPDSLIKWIQKMENIKKISNDANASSFVDGTTDCDDMLEDSVEIDTEEALKNFMEDPDPDRARTSSIEYPPSALNTGSVIEEILTKAADVHRQFLDELDQNMTNALQEAEILKGGDYTPWHKPRHEAAALIQNAFIRKPSIDDEESHTDDATIATSKQEEDHTWHAATKISVSSPTSLATQFAESWEEPSDVSVAPSLQLQTNDLEGSKEATATAIQSIIRGRAARKDSIIRQKEMLSLLQAPEPEPAIMRSSESEPEPPSEKISDTAQVLDQPPAGKTIETEEKIPPDESSTKSPSSTNTKSRPAVFVNTTKPRKEKKLQVESLEHTPRDPPPFDISPSLPRFAPPDRFGSPDPGSRVTSPNLQRCVTPDSLSKVSYILDDNSPEISTRRPSLKGEKTPCRSPSHLGWGERASHQKASSHLFTHEKRAEFLPTPTVKRKHSIADMSAKLNIKSLNLNDTVPDNFDLYRPSNAFQDRDAPPLSSREDTELSGLLTELTTITARRPLSPNKIQKTIESRPYMPIQPPVVSYMTKTTYSSSVNKLSPLLRKKIDQDHASKLQSLWAIKTSLSEVKQLTESLKGVHASEYCEVRPSKQFSRVNDDQTFEGRNLPNNSVWSSSSKSTFSSNTPDSKQSKPNSNPPPPPPPPLCL